MSGEAPTVSVVVPVYNALPYLEQTIRAIQDQTFQDFEILVIDDRSSDGSLALAEQLSRQDERITVIRMEHRSGGPAGPRNAGVELARGEWVAFCDADDVWMPEKLACQLGILAESRAVMCSTEAKRFSGSVNLAQYCTTDGPPWRKVGFFENQVKNKIVTSSVLVRRDALDKHKFKTDEAYRVVEDYDCWLRILEEYGFCAKILHPLVAYRISDGQISANKLKQIGRVFGVHWRYGGPFSKLGAFVFSISHVIGAAYQRFFRLSV
jgi:teichuronic acid biosynthesis glycosyltransferase TuaG